MKSFILLLLSALSCHAAMQFNGSNSELLTRRNANGPPPLTYAGGRITLAAWVKRFDTNTTYFLAFTFPGSPQTVGTYSLGFNKLRTNCVEFSYEDGTTDATHVFSSPPNVGSTTNVWMHIGFTYNYASASSAGLWVNGLPVAGAWTVGTGGIDPITTSGTLHIGSGLEQTVFFNGEIGEATMFYQQTMNTREMALIASKIKRLPLQLRPQAGDGVSGGEPLSPCVYWPLDQAPSLLAVPAVTNIFDISHYGRFATISSTTLAPKNTVIGKGEQVCSYPPNE